MENDIFLKDNVKFFREKLGLSKEALGRAFGQKRGVISSLEATNPSHPNIMLLNEMVYHFSKGNEKINLSSFVNVDFTGLNEEFNVYAVLKSLKLDHKLQPKSTNKDQVVISRILEILDGTDSETIEISRSLLQSIVNTATKYLFKSR